MFITHQFAHQETLDRARYWLEWLGFLPGQMEVLTEGAPRIALRGASSEMAEAKLLFAALERSDPYGPAGFWDDRHHFRAGPHRAEPVEELGQHASTVLGWHPVDLDLRTDPQFRALCEAMER